MIKSTATRKFERFLYFVVGLSSLPVEMSCLTVKFRRDVNLLDVLTQYEILGFCRLGLNRLGADY